MASGERPTLFNTSLIELDQQPYVLIDRSGSTSVTITDKNYTMLEWMIKQTYNYLLSENINEIYCILWNHNTKFPFGHELINIEELLSLDTISQGGTILYQALDLIPEEWINRKTKQRDIYIITDGLICDNDNLIHKSLKKLFGSGIDIYIITFENNYNDYYSIEMNVGTDLYNKIFEGNMTKHVKKFLSYNNIYSEKPFINLYNPTVSPNEAPFRNSVFRVDKINEFFKYIEKLIKELNSKEMNKLTHELSLTIYYLIKDKPNTAQNNIIDLFCKLFKNNDDYINIRKSIFNEIENHRCGNSSTYSTFNKKKAFKKAQLELYNNTLESITSTINDKCISFTTNCIFIVDTKLVKHNIILYGNNYNNSCFKYNQYTIPVLPMKMIRENDIDQNIRGWIRNNVSIMYNTNPVSDDTIWMYIFLFIFPLLLSNIPDDIKEIFKIVINIILDRTRYQKNITEREFLLKNRPTSNSGYEKEFDNILYNCMKILNIKMEPLSFWYSFLKVFNDPILIQAQKEFCRKYLNIDKLDDKNICDVIKSKLLVEYKIIDLSNNYDYTCPISNINTCNEGGYAYPMHMLGDIECNPKCVLSKDEYELVKNYCIPCPICDEMIDSNKLIEVPKINTENININEYYKNKCVYVTKELLNSIDYKKIIPMNKCDLTHEQYIIDFPHLKNPLNTAFPIIKTQEEFNKIVYEKYPYLELPWKKAVILGGFSISIILEQKVRDFDIIFYGENCYDIFVDILQKLVLNLKQTYSEQIIKCLKSSKEQFNVFEVDIIEDPNNCYDNDILITDIINKNYKEDGIKLLHRFQFILSKNNSLEDIFNKVDFYPSMIAWDGETTWMTQRTAYAYKYMLNEIEEDNYNDIFSYRLAKYYNKGFCIGLDKLDIDKLPQKFTIDEFTCEIIKIDKKCIYINYISEYNDNDLEYEELKNKLSTRLYRHCESSKLADIFKYIIDKKLVYNLSDDVDIKIDNEKLQVNNIDINFTDFSHNVKFYKDIYGEYKKI